MFDNSLSAYWYALSKDCPGKLWWDADHTAGRSTIRRALGIAPGDEGGWYAIAPFRFFRSETGKASILAAWPAPLVLDEPTPDWLDIQTVIAWNPVKDTARVLGDPVPQLVGVMREDANALFSSPRAFFQAWASRRAIHAVRHREASAKEWHVVPPERDEVPGALMIGTPASIRWNPAALPEHIECRGCDAREINRAILRAARLPRATGYAA